MVSIRQRVAALDWPAIVRALDERGHATTPTLLTPDDCGRLARLFDDDARFRQTIDMGRYRFGDGCYRYFGDPLPAPVAALRTLAYPRLAPIASRWTGAAFPADFAAFRKHCHEKGQRRPTPLLLRYHAGGYNRLHQDLYGGVVFPLQITVMLSRPGRDFTGGEFLLVEQSPRMQSRGHAIALQQGEAVIFATRERPVAGRRGTYRAILRHGVSTVHTGTRTTLGIIFHDAT